MTAAFLFLALLRPAATAAEDSGAGIIRRSALAAFDRGVLTEAHAEPSWNGSFGGFVLRGLYVTYRSVFAASDLPVCNFNPSCSHFSEQAVATCGIGRGILLTADRLLRDNPFAAGNYPPDSETGLLLDPVSRYCER